MVAYNSKMHIITSVCCCFSSLFLDSSNARTKIKIGARTYFIRHAYGTHIQLHIFIKHIRDFRSFLSLSSFLYLLHQQHSFLKNLFCLFIHYIYFVRTCVHWIIWIVAANSWINDTFSLLCYRLFSIWAENVCNGRKPTES